jgi:hypothetical protein
MFPMCLCVKKKIKNGFYTEGSPLYANIPKVSNFWNVINTVKPTSAQLSLRDVFYKQQQKVLN